jgi:uncharacterized membrane protein
LKYQKIYIRVLDRASGFFENDFTYKMVYVSVPMNKIVVGNTPSPNLKKVQPKVGSLANAAHKVRQQSDLQL